MSSSEEAASSGSLQTSETGFLVTLRGGCHCGRVAFELKINLPFVVWRCNCSICTMKQNHHFIVPKARFQLIEGDDNLTCYTFGTHTAKHLFCKTCGIHSFYQPRSNPDCYAVTIYCIVPGTLKKGDYEFKDYDGENWEKAYVSTGIAKLSNQ